MLITWEVGLDPLLGSGKYFVRSNDRTYSVSLLLAWGTLALSAPGNPASCSACLSSSCPFPHLHSLLLVSFSAIFPLCSNPGHPCSLDLLCLLNPPQLFLPTLRKHSTFICQLEEQETSPPAHSVSYMSALSVFFRIVSEMETRLTRGPRPGLDNQLPDGFSKAQERTVVSLLNLLILCFPFHCSLLFYFLLPFPLGFAVFFFNFLF